MIRFSSLVLLLALLPLLAAADTLTGRVVKVTDGDTVHVLDASQTRHKIRLQGIDAPERKQAFGKRSKQYLTNLVAGRVVEVDWHQIENSLVGLLPVVAQSDQRVKCLLGQLLGAFIIAGIQSPLRLRKQVENGQGLLGLGDALVRL